MVRSDNKLCVVVFEPQPIYSEGLHHHIAEQPDLQICAEVNTARDAILAIRQLKPAIAIVSLSLLDGVGLEWIKHAHADSPDTKILVLSCHDDRYYPARVQAAGAAGFLHKARTGAEIIAAMRAILAGETVFPSPGTQIADNIQELTDRELEVFELIAAGEDKHTIAHKLHVSVKTVDTHRENIKAKLNLSSMIALAQYATRWRYRREAAEADTTLMFP